MYLHDVHKKEEIRLIAIQDLRDFGIKYRPKKQRPLQDARPNKKVFKKHLHLLPTQIVTLRSGQQLIVPKLIHELCSFISSKAKTEGLFRKGGSKSRQNEIKLLLDAGCYLGDEHHEIDVANILKTFLRELPEPLLPYSYHELFLRCMMLENNRLEAMLLACLLLPVEHLNTLAYVMQFMHQVTEFSQFNKMDSYNLAVIIGPTILPSEEKNALNTQHRLLKTCELFKLMIENSSSIGFLPENIIERIAVSSESVNSDESNLPGKKKKKRRSGSLTRMFSGLRKYVGGKSNEEPTTVTPDLLLTPRITRSSKKRKVEGSGFSFKKKQELLSNLPQSTVLSTPFTPHRTPISVHPNPKKNVEPAESPNKIEAEKQRKSQWYFRNKNNKISKNEELSVRNALERRWSVVGNGNSSKKNKNRHSCAGALEHKKIDKNANCNKDVEEEYVKISKNEYEEIKNRVSEIERRISIELQKTPGNEDEVDIKSDDEVKHVQTVYEQTLVQAEPLSPTTDHLAKRLSRELKIRRSAEQKIFRSPSARKIGNLRRRSRELEQLNNKLCRNQSWHFGSDASRAISKRERPNTVLTRIPLVSQNDHLKSCEEKLSSFSTNVRITRSSSLNDGHILSYQNLQVNNSDSSSASANKWISAEGFFCTSSLSGDISNSRFDSNCRASLVRLRNQNAGMVQAKARLFNEMLESDKSIESQQTVLIPRVRASHKIGSLRNPDKMSHRVRTLRHEERRLPKKSISPRKKPLLANRHKMQLAKKNEKENRNFVEPVKNISVKSWTSPSPLKDCNRIDLPDLHIKSPYYAITPKSVPVRFDSF